MRNWKTLSAFELLVVTEYYYEIVINNKLVLHYYSYL